MPETELLNIDNARPPRPIEDFVAAAADGQLATVTEMVTADSTLLRQFDRYGITALQSACSTGKTDVAAFLLGQGAAVELTKNSEVILAACDAGNIELVRTLLEHKADINGFERHGGPPVVTASARGHLELVTHAPPLTTLHRFVCSDLAPVPSISGLMVDSFKYKRLPLLILSGQNNGADYLQRRKRKKSKIGTSKAKLAKTSDHV